MLWLAYIETDDEDLFIVGSGNLTPAGQGRQLEVLDGVNAIAQDLEKPPSQWTTTAAREGALGGLRLCPQSR
ncbi:hypothetical protein [Cupriavidus basilensis]|uniref:hypothetical protein n=1 Tax=Cupriavidus basilensis TaxID=68895 RepID=UPI0023E79D43|nr:hypothetical protein [Cupriavidus basilensis]MDF3881593.1 hypothetical protein [Cupriavidus basilensis]